MSHPTDYSLIRLPEVLRRRGRSRSAHYRDIDAGLFPHPVAIGAMAIAWPDYEVAAVNDARVAGKTDEEIRALVVSLEAVRLRRYARAVAREESWRREVRNRQRAAAPGIPPAGVSYSSGLPTWGVHR